MRVLRIEWVGYMKLADYEFKEYDTRLTQKFINSLDDEVIIEEIIGGLTGLKDTSEVSSNKQ